MTKKNGKVKVKEIHKSDIFSVTKEGQQETVLYFQNEMFGDVFTEEEMRFYLAGESDSRANYKARHVFIIGILACGGVAYWGGDGYFTAVVPPLLFTGTQLIGKIKIREKTISDPAYKYNDIYSMGYEPTARSKRLIRATQGGFLGSALGVAIWFLLGKK